MWDGEPRTEFGLASTITSRLTKLFSPRLFSQNAKILFSRIFSLKAMKGTSNGAKWGRRQPAVFPCLGSKRFDGSRNSRGCTSTPPIHDAPRNGERLLEAGAIPRASRRRGYTQFRHVGVPLHNLYQVGEQQHRPWCEGGASRVETRGKGTSWKLRCFEGLNLSPVLSSRSSAKVLKNSLYTFSTENRREPRCVRELGFWICAEKILRQWMYWKVCLITPINSEAYLFEYWFIYYGMIRAVASC